MSAFIVAKVHIDALVTAALNRYPGDMGPLSWFSRPLSPGETAVAYEVGEPWGSEAPRISKYLRREATSEEADRIGQMLMRENLLSVNHRYRESRTEGIYTYEETSMCEVDPMVILKAISCYEYQSCEHPGWEHSEAHDFCRALRLRMIHLLPGYEEAPWEIETKEQYLKEGPC